VNFEYKPDGGIEGHFFMAEPGQLWPGGHTGSGKTTLVALLQKFYLPRRTVLVDGTDLNQVTSDSLRSQMGSVQQNNFLFLARCWTTSGSRSRRRRRPTCGRRWRHWIAWICWTVAQGLQARWRTGRGAVVRPAATGVFARAMLANPRIVVLDEATSAIDTVTKRGCSGR